MNWYFLKIAQGLDNYLRGLGVGEDIIGYITSMPDKKQSQFFVNEVRKNPGVTLQDLQGFQAPQKVDPYMPHERQMASRFPPQAQQWVLVNLKQARESRLGLDPQSLLLPGGGANLGIPQYNSTWNKLDYFARTNDVKDWLDHNPSVDINSYSIDEVDELTSDWHAVMSGKGEGKMYGPANPDLISYGPNWKNEEWKGWTIQEVRGENDLLAEGNKMNHCFAAGTLVRTKEGYKPIEKIRVGDLALCENGTFRMVNQTFKRHYEGNAVRFRTRFGISDILVTANHKIMSLVPLHRGEKPCSKTSCGNLHRVKDVDANHTVDWVEANLLNSHSYLCSKSPIEFFDLEHIDVPSIYTGENRKGDKTFKVDEEFLWIIGMYIAEGSSTENHLSFALSAEEVNFAERIITFLRKHGFSPKIRKDKEDYGGLVVVFSSRMLAGWFRDWIGHGCDNKKIPTELLNLPNEKIKYLIQGIADGDGHDKRNELHQTSLMLALQVVEIGLRLGSCPTNSVKDNSHRNRKTSCMTEYANPNVSRSSLLKNTKRAASRQKNIWVHKNNTLIKPCKWENCYFDGDVYNFEVDTIHSYVVENILVENCVGSYCEGVERGETRIFSLRDPSNNPHVTIETDPRGDVAQQIQGNSNSEPDDQYKQMIKEWVQSGTGPVDNAEGGDESPLENLPYYAGLEEMNNVLSSVGDQAQEMDDYGLSTGNLTDPVLYDPDSLIDLFINSAKKENSNSRGNDYFGDINETPELLVDAMLRLGMPKFVELEEALGKKGQEADEEMYSHWDFTPSQPPPDQGDYETDEEYHEAYGIWEEEEQGYEQEYMDEYASQHLPHGFFMDAFKYIAKLREEGKIPTYEELHRKVASGKMNWYKQAKLDEKDIGMKKEFNDLVVNVENSAGTDRVGIDKDGKEWRTHMKYDYGFIHAQKGEDGEGLDVYLGPDEEAKNVFVVHQNKPDTGKYDEDKCMLGFENQKAAKKAYLDHYDSEKFFGGMTVVQMDEFKDIVNGKSKSKTNWKKKGKKVRR